MSSQPPIPSQFGPTGPPPGRGPSTGRIIGWFITAVFFVTVVGIVGFTMLGAKIRRQQAVAAKLQESRATAAEFANTVAESDYVDSAAAEDYFTRQVKTLEEAAAVASGHDATMLRCIIQRMEVLGAAVRTHAKLSDEVMRDGIFVPGGLDTPEKLAAKIDLLERKQAAVKEVINAYKVATDDFLECSKSKGVPSRVAAATAKEFGSGMSIAVEFQQLEQKLGGLLLEMLELLRGANFEYAIKDDGSIEFTGANRDALQGHLDLLLRWHSEAAAEQELVMQRMVQATGG